MIGKHWLLYALAVGSINLLLRYFTNLIKTSKDVIVLWESLLVLFVVAGQVIGARPKEPNLIGGIQNVVTGPNPGNDRDTVAILEMTVMNSGTMQSIATGWKIDAEIDGQKYNGTIADMPETFTFNFPDILGQNSMEYHKSDLIVPKTMTPIQPGGLTPGIMFLIFEGINSQNFKSGSQILVTFEDIYQKKYSATTTATAKARDRLTTLPGLHTEMVCRAPPNLLPQQSLSPQQSPQQSIPPSR